MIFSEGLKEIILPSIILSFADGSSLREMRDQVEKERGINGVVRFMRFG
jgi:hypothetical protein